MDGRRRGWRWDGRRSNDAFIMHQRRRIRWWRPWSITGGPFCNKKTTTLFGRMLDVSLVAGRRFYDAIVVLRIVHRDHWTSCKKTLDLVETNFQWIRLQLQSMTSSLFSLVVWTFFVCFSSCFSEPMTRRRFIIISLSVCIMKFGSNKDPRVWSVVLPSIFNIIIKLFTCMAGQHDDGTRGWPEDFFGGKKQWKCKRQTMTRELDKQYKTHHFPFIGIYFS